MNKILLTTLISIICLNFSLSAQDKILFKNGTEVKGWVIETSEKEIKYRIMQSEDSPLVIMNINNIDKIEYRDGQIINYTPNQARMKRRLGLNVGAMLASENGIGKVQIDYFYSPAINFELNVLISPDEYYPDKGLSVGSKYYFSPYSSSGFKGYTGLLIGVLNDDFSMQVPFGISYTANCGFDLKLGVNTLIYPNKPDYRSKLYIFGEILVGWRF